MRVGNQVQVQYMTGRRSVHARKDNITIQSFPEYVIFIDSADLRDRAQRAEETRDLGTDGAKCANRAPSLL